MAYISFQPNDYFNTVTYSGTSGTTDVTTGFQPDMVWTKDRGRTETHCLYDAVRGVTKRIRPDNTAAEGTETAGVSAFNTDGFTTGQQGGSGQDGYNYVSWNWKAGTTSGITTNSDTSITPSAYSFNQTSGFSMVEYTGTAVDGAYLPHGLGKAPELLFLKQTSGTEPWQVYSKPTGYGGRGWLNLGDAFQTSRGEWYSTNPDSVNMRISNDSHINASGATYIAYFFTSIKGYCNIGNYIGTGSATDAPFIYTGFKPAFVLIKRSNDSGDWYMHDNKRDVDNPVDISLSANSTNADNTQSNILDLVSNGFKIRNTGTGYNASGSTYIYMAFADKPLVASNGDSATGF